jgi:hypothetical protein
MTVILTVSLNDIRGLKKFGKTLFSVASQERFELPTDGLEGRCSILLSYWDII